MEADYSDAAYEAEVSRLQNVTAEIRSYRGETVTLGVREEQQAYHYPAVVASDGFDDVYEYALLDEAGRRIVYVLLSYPRSLQLDAYTDYLKIDADAYAGAKRGNTLENFTIYAHTFDGGQSYEEYTDRIFN